MKVFDFDVGELLNASAGKKERFDHESVFALHAVGALNETLDFGAIQPLNRSLTRARRLELQLAAGLLHHVFRLVVVQVSSTPEPEGLRGDHGKGGWQVRDHWMTTRFMAFRGARGCH